MIWTRVSQRVREASGTLGGEGGGRSRRQAAKETKREAARQTKK